MLFFKKSGAFRKLFLDAFDKYHTVQLSIEGKNWEKEGKIEGIILKNRGQIEGILKGKRGQNLLSYVQCLKGPDTPKRICDYQVNIA